MYSNLLSVTTTNTLEFANNVATTIGHHLHGIIITFISSQISFKYC